jgi:type II secretory pathway pseudopilin PulG
MKSERSNERGFTYIDVLIAVAILLVGVMALVSAITYAIVGTTRNQSQLLAKQYATSTIESVFSARDVTLLQWDTIGNVGSAEVPAGIFPPGAQIIYDSAGIDGIVGTADDQAGDDGTIGTTDDPPPVDGFLRTITITDVPDPDRPGAPITMRQIAVTIDFFSGSQRLRESFSTYVANFSRQ